MIILGINKKGEKDIVGEKMNELILREYVRKTLLEVYELSAEDMEIRDQIDDPNERRAAGVQTRGEIRYERSLLRQYQKELNQTPEGKKLIKKFMEGEEVTILHSIMYSGWAKSVGLKDIPEIDEEKPITSWIRRYGSNNKDVLSCVASLAPLGTNIKRSGNPSNEHVLKELAFVMKGYPVYISPIDVMSQTLGAIPQGLIDHQKNSGIAKRPGSTRMGIKSDFYWAGEVLLDNWSIKGVYLPIEKESPNNYLIELVLKECMAAKLPLYIYSYGNGEFIAKLNNFNDFNKLF